MKRKAIETLIQWKEADDRIPILITGAKGVGKTYLAYDFAKAFFERILYLNFEYDLIMREILSKSEPDQAIELLIAHFQITQEESKNTILILDEISYCKAAEMLLQSLSIAKAFPYLIGITSKPIAIDKKDCICSLPMVPMEFDEFLTATGNEWYLDLICTHYHSNSKLPDIVHKELMDLFYLYLQTGGMPSSINEYLNLNTVANLSEQHSILMGAINNRIITEYSEGDSLKMTQVMDSIPHQLMKDNRKFQYKLIRKGTTYTMYREAIQKLIEINNVIKCNRINNELVTEKFNIDNYNTIFEDEANTAFKLYLMDTGLLNSKIKQNYNITQNHLYKSALLENQVAQSLQAKRYPYAFWESDSIAKLDFIIYKENSLIPIEIFMDTNTRSKSLSVFKQKYDFPYAIKISAKNFEFSGGIKYIPHYALFCI